ncbi:Abortive infection C-terminus [Pontibacter indicus]|uniref:Abortive infection C-terminus n=2 Tax=Pontibacter indicus TaxID=1317125 RepID=A0A1R3XFC2_9BACT|nr:Abortive infection C-terminus [Pontibacter indicus]
MSLRVLLTRLATGEDKREDGEEYVNLRNELFANTFTKALLPEFVISCRILSDFWPYIKCRFSTYAERREYIREEFEPLLVHLESDRLYSHDHVINYSIEKFDCDSVNYMWGKALGRREDDPDGAITAARSLIESVCKQILKERNIEYDDSFDLPKLFKTTARSLNLAPQLHNENILKQILSGIQTTVHGFASLRNELSDAHGQPKGGYRVSKRHSELAVNLAGSIASFLIQTHHETLLKSTSN